MGKGKRRQRYAESTLDPGGGLVAVNDAAARELWIGDGFRHCAHARGRHVARLQELFPFVRAELEQLGAGPASVAALPRV